MAIHRHFTKNRRFATKMSKKMNAHAGTLNFRAMEKQPRAQIEEKYVEIKYHRGGKNGKMVCCLIKNDAEPPLFQDTAIFN